MNGPTARLLIFAMFRLTLSKDEIAEWFISSMRPPIPDCEIDDRPSLLIFYYELFSLFSGISLALAVGAAVTLSFTLDFPPENPYIFNCADTVKQTHNLEEL